MAQERESRAGVSYADVEAAMRDIQRQFNCNVGFKVSIPVVQGTSVVFWVAIEATPRWVGKVTVRGAVARQRRWPHVDHKTMAGLMLWLCYDLSAALDGIGQVPVQEALFD